MTNKKNNNNCQASHPNHEEQIKSLNRVSGQIDGIKKMIQNRRYCIDIITQTRAIQSAIHAIELKILKTHLTACIKEAFIQQDKVTTETKIEELLTLFKKLDK
tara:strand:+ start:387 stop:695 length:309 start_codon:yes stop_codon:yes gene_type:complete